MMKPYILLIVISFIPYSFANDAQRAKRLRDQLNLDFKNEVNAMMNCNKEMRALSAQALQIKIDLLNSDCKNIQQINQLKQCINNKENSLKKMKALLQNIFAVQIHCNKFQISIFAGPLNSSIENLDTNLSNLKTYYEKTIAQNQAIKNENQKYDGNRYFFCSMDISNQYVNTLDVEFRINRSYYTNNVNKIYILKQELKELKALNDYIQTKAKLCLSSIPPAHLLKEKDEKSIANIKRRVQNSQNLLDKELARLQNENLNESPKKVCHALKETHDLEPELCDNPSNNPSWTYSINHFIKETLFKDQ